MQISDHICQILHDKKHFYGIQISENMPYISQKKILWIGKDTPQLPHFTETKIANVFYVVQISDKIIANCSQKLQIL